MGKEALSNTPRCAAHTIMAQWVQQKKRKETTPGKRKR